MTTTCALTGDRAVNTVWLWLDDCGRHGNLGNAIRDLLPPGTEHDMRTPGEMRQLSLAAFDRTFAITYLLELVAVTIGLFGIAAGISAQVLARRSEFGALRHLGFTRGQIATMLAIEGSVLGALGVIVGTARRRGHQFDSDLCGQSAIVSLEHGFERAAGIARRA